MKPLQIGICVPPRPHIGEPNYDRPDLWGCLRQPSQTDLIAYLRGLPGCIVRTDLDFRNAFIHKDRIWIDSTCLNELDGYFWYCEIDRAPNSYHLQVLKTLAYSIPVFPNPWHWEIAVDKYTAHLALARAGVRVPEFILFNVNRPGMPTGIEQLLERWGAALLKPRRGGWGKGVTLVDSAALLRDLIGYIRSTATSSLEGGFLLERYYENDPKRWVSITLCGNRIMYGYQKKDSKIVSLGEKRYKVFDENEQGGEVRLQPLCESHINLVKRANQTLNCPIIGFDTIWTEGDPMVVDENTSPGNYPELYAASGLEPAVEIGATIGEWISQVRDTQIES